MLQVGVDDFLPESNAACFYLADGSDLIPHDRFARADMLRWLFWEQYNHEPNVATLRFWQVLIGLDNLSEGQRAMLAGEACGGRSGARVDGRASGGRDWFVADRLTLADIALYAYTHVAETGGFSLRPYPAVRAWLDRVAALPRYIPMDA